MKKAEKRFVKIGTMPGNWVKVRFHGKEKVGARLQFQEVEHGKWIEAIIWAIGPEPEKRLYMDLA